jgi:hypothetical protein
MQFPDSRCAPLADAIGAFGGDADKGKNAGRHYVRMLNQPNLYDCTLAITLPSGHA